MRFAPALPLAAVLLASAATAQPGRQTIYRAAGTEPFWSLSIDRRMMRFEQMNGARIAARTPRVINGFAGELYRTPQLKVNIVHKACNDGMSDRTYRDTVTVTTRRGVFQGCGGGVVAAHADAGLANTRWRIERVNDQPLPGGQPTSVRFTGNRIEGKICNSFGGPYREDGNQLIAGDIIATQMACSVPLNIAEGGFFAMLRGPVRVGYDQSGSLLVLNRGRTTVTLRRDR